MLLKSKTISGAASPKSSSMSPSNDDDDGAKTTSTMTDDATARATATAVAKAKEVIRNGGTQAEAAAAAREVARSVLKEMMQVSSVAGDVTTGRSGGANSDCTDDNVASTANQSRQASASDVEFNLPMGARNEAKTCRPGGLPPLVPKNAGVKVRGGLLSKFRKKMRTSKDKKMKSVPEEKMVKQVAIGNESEPMVMESIEDSRDEVEVVPLTEKLTVRKVGIVHVRGDDSVAKDGIYHVGGEDTDEREADILSNSSEAADAIVASGEEEVPQIVSKSSSGTSLTDSTYYSTYDDLDSFVSERVRHPRNSYYMKERAKVNDKDSFASDVNILDAMLNMDSFMDALNEALFPASATKEGATKKSNTTTKESKRSVDIDDEEGQGRCSILKIFTGSGGCCAQDSHCDNSFGYSDFEADGESIKSDIANCAGHVSSHKDTLISQSVAGASTHNVDPSVTVSNSASASLNQKEDDDVMQHNKSVSWATSLMGRDYHAPKVSTTKNSAMSTSAAKFISAAATNSYVRNSGQTKTLSKLNVVSTNSTAQSKNGIETSNDAENNDTNITKSCVSSITSNMQNEEDGTVADDSISSKVKILFRNTMSNIPLCAAAKAGNQCLFPTDGLDEAINPEITVAANRGNHYLPNWRDSVVDTVQTTARPVNGNIEQSQLRPIQQQQVIHPTGQGYFQQQQPIVSPHESIDGFHLSSPLSHYPQAVGFQNNHTQLALSSQRFSPMNSHHQGSYYQAINGDGSQWQNQLQSTRYEFGQQHPNLPGGLPRINSNLSVLSADDKRDRYAGMEQLQMAEQDQTMDHPGPFHSPVMGSSAVGGYGDANVFGLTSHQGHQGTEARGHVGGNIVYYAENDNGGYPNTMMTQFYNGADGQDMSPRTVGLTSLAPTEYAYHLQQQQQLEQHRNQPRLRFSMNNGQQYMQSPLAYQ